MEFNLGPLPLVAILRGLSPEQAPQVGRILFDAGFRLLEVPLNRPGAIESIRELLRIAPTDAVIGGGTMLTVKHVDEVHAAGGRMMVSPNFEEDVVRRAVVLGMLTLPGVATPTEGFRAMAAGAHGLKLFPAEMIPPAAVKAFRSVLPSSIQLMPVGGIDPDSMQRYVQAGADGFGIGGALYQPTIAMPALKQAADRFMSARAALL